MNPIQALIFLKISLLILSSCVQDTSNQGKGDQSYNALEDQQLKASLDQQSQQVINDQQLSISNDQKLDSPIDQQLNIIKDQSLNHILDVLIEGNEDAQSLSDQAIVQSDSLLIEGEESDESDEEIISGLPVEIDPSQRLPLNPVLPGGWRSSTFVFSQAKMKADLENNEWVQLGWFTLNADESFTACGNSGPKVERTFYRWSHSLYPAGNCDQDIKDQVNFQRWDHSTVEIDRCPGDGEWVEANGQIAQRDFLYDCPIHVPAGFGNAVQRVSYQGNYVYLPEEKTLILKYAVPTANGAVCKKEYYRNLIHDAQGKLLSMSLDGDKTADMSAEHRGLGGSIGYAYGSSADIFTHQDLNQSMSVFNDPNRSFVSDAWRFREDREGELPLEHYQRNQALNYQPILCREHVYFDHSCESTNQSPPFLRECTQGNSAKTAYLRFWVDPFPRVNSRENLYWAWHAHHAPNWTGCYHRGSHSHPLLQVIDTDGQFRGYVGIEIQKSAQTIGINQTPENAYQKTDYRVFRWIEHGFEEAAYP